MLELTEFHGLRPVRATQKVYGGGRLEKGQANQHRPSTKKGVIEGFNAYCDSNRCCNTVVKVDHRGVKTYRRLETLIRKDVPRGTFQCPDCMMALRWIRA